MTAGLTTLREWSKPGVFEEVEAATTRLVTGIKEIARSCGVPIQAASAGTMFGTFFTDQKVKDYVSAKTSDTARYAHYFHALLEQGVYMAPSQFEAAFTSTAHTTDVIDRTLDAIRVAIPALLEPSKR